MRATKKKQQQPFTLHLTTDEQKKKWPKCDMSNARNLKYAISSVRETAIESIQKNKLCLTRRGKVELKNIFYGYFVDVEMPEWEKSEFFICQRQF